MLNTKRPIYLVVILLFLFACRSTKHVSPNNVLTNAYQITKHQRYTKAAIATAHPLASAVGKEILLKGGNAIDAAIAVQFALAVVYPVAGNIGGGGFMVIRLKDGTANTLDFREKAPLRAHKDMYLDENRDVIKGLSLKGHLAAGVPGTVDGMVKAFNLYSKLKDWSQLVEPAIKLAHGIKVTKLQAARLNKYRDDFLNVNGPNHFVKDDLWKEGDMLVQSDLANSLALIAKNKRDGFYKGPVAEAIVKESFSGKGIISQADLDSYASVWREPIRGNYRNHEVISMPPPSSGGTSLMQLLKCIEPYPVGSYGFHSAESIHLMVEAERRVYADRATHLGDPDFYDVPKNELISAEYNTSRMSDFDPKHATVSDSIKAGKPQESEETTHFSIIDDEGNAVSLTTTINTAYGSKVIIDGAGFFLNNEMDDFSAKPGVPNFFGVLGNEANSIAPEKRMLSSMTPTIVTYDDKVKIITGTPGGSTIITSIFQVLVNIIDFDMNANEATQSCRFHHQWLPDKISVEEGCLDLLTINKLKSMGHTYSSRSSIGKVETIIVTDSNIECAADRRGDDSTSGY